ncbi:MAG: hypothetical protein AAGC60_02465 [Acidobacteriota bacterium]
MDTFAVQGEAALIALKVIAGHVDAIFLPGRFQVDEIDADFGLRLRLGLAAVDEFVVGRELRGRLARDVCCNERQGCEDEESENGRSVH